MIKSLLKILFILFFAISLFGCFDSAFNKIQKSNELSNLVLIDSARKTVGKIHLSRDSISKRQADSVLNAVIDINGLIDSYKEQIINLSMVDKDVDLAYKVIATPEIIKGALLSASSQLDKTISNTSVPYNSVKADSLLVDIRKINSDTLYFEKTFKGIQAANALVILSNLQLQSSVACNFALNVILKKSK